MVQLASSTNNIRYNGTGRVYFGDVGGSSLQDLGELENLTFSQEVAGETKIKSTRNAARATLITMVDEREATLAFGVREMTKENLAMLLLADAYQNENQAASFRDLADLTVVADKYVELGKVDVHVHKVVHGTVTGGSFEVGETVTGGTSGATGKVAWAGDSFLELVNVVGTFEADEELTGGTSAATATASSVAKVEDVVVLDDATTPTVRYALGTDYSLDPDAGLFRVLSAGSIVGDPAVAFDYPEIDIAYTHGLANGSAEKRLVFVSDGGDSGPRQRWTFHNCQINLNGEFPLIGDGLSILQVSAAIQKDGTQAVGQEYYKHELIG